MRGLPKRAPLSVPTKKIPSPKFSSAGPKSRLAREHHRSRNLEASSTLTSSHHGTPIASLEAQRNADCCSLLGFPRQESTAAMYAPRSRLVLPDRNADLCSLRCPPVRGMSRRTDRSRRTHVDERIPLAVSESTGSTRVVVVWPVVRYGGWRFQISTGMG